MTILNDSLIFYPLIDIITRGAISLTMEFLFNNLCDEEE